MISEVDHTFPLVRLNPKHLLRRPDEVAGVTLGVKGYDIGLEKASQGAFTHVTWQDTPRLGIGPGDMDEEGDEGVVAEALPKRVRDHIELVIVDEDHGLLTPDSFKRAAHGLGEVLAYDDVAVLPGPLRILAKLWFVRKVVETVLNEPEQRVGQVVIHQVVGFLVVLDEDDLQVFDLVGFLETLFSNACVLLALGRGDPDNLLSATRDGVQCRNEAPCPTGVPALTRLASREGHWPPVRDDNEPRVLRRLPATLASCAHVYPPRGLFSALRLHAKSFREEFEVAAQAAGRWVLLPDVFFAAASQLAGEVWVFEDLQAGGRGLRDVVHEQATPIDNLHRNTTNPAGDQWPSLPERLRHHEPKPLTNRLLHHHVSHGLEGVYLDGADVGEVGEEEDVPVAVGIVDGLVPVVPAFRVIVGHRADKYELHLGDLFFHDPVGIYNSQRVLPGVEARDLQDEQPLAVYAELVGDVAGIVGREGHVLRREGVYGRRDDDQPLEIEVRRGVLHHGVDLGVVVPDVRKEVVEDLAIRG